MGGKTAAGVGSSFRIPFAVHFTGAATSPGRHGMYVCICIYVYIYCTYNTHIHIHTYTHTEILPSTVKMESRHMCV